MHNNEHSDSCHIMQNNVHILICMCQRPDSNQRPFPYQGNALPAELHWHTYHNDGVHGDERTRTDNFMRAKHMLYQLNYTPRR